MINNICEPLVDDRSEVEKALLGETGYRSSLLQTIKAVSRGLLGNGVVRPSEVPLHWLHDLTTRVEISWTFESLAEHFGMPIPPLAAKSRGGPE
jgi:hypothetical protein